MTKFYQVTLTKKRFDVDGVHINKVVEYYEVEGRSQILNQIYARYNKNLVSDILIELIDGRIEIDGDNCKVSTNHEVGKLQGEITTNGIEA